jgi:hypothetical protein
MSWIIYGKILNRGTKRYLAEYRGYLDVNVKRYLVEGAVIEGENLRGIFAGDQEDTGSKI